MDASKYYKRFEPMHRYKIFSFKNNTWVEIHVKVQINTFGIDCNG